MAKFGFLGSALGLAAGLALAPATGGASLALYAAAGAATGATVGSQLDSARSEKKSRKIANEELSYQRNMRDELAKEKQKADSMLRKERSRVEAGMARSARRRFRSGAGFLSGTVSDGVSEVLG